MIKIRLMKLLPTKDVAKALGLSVQRIHALINSGRLPAQKIGRDYLINEKDLELVRERKAGRPKKDKSS